MCIIYGNGKKKTHTNTNMSIITHLLGGKDKNVSDVD